MSYDAKTWGSRSPFSVTSQRKQKPESNWLSTVWFLHVRLICLSSHHFFTLTEWRGWLLHTVYDICLQGLIWRQRPEFSEAPRCSRRVAWLWSAQKALVRAVARPWLVSSDIMSHTPEGNSSAAAVGRLRMAVSALGPGSKQIPQRKHWNIQSRDLCMVPEPIQECTVDERCNSIWRPEIEIPRFWNWGVKLLKFFITSVMHFGRCDIRLVQMNAFVE